MAITCCKHNQMAYSELTGYIFLTTNGKSRNVCSILVGFTIIGHTIGKLTVFNNLY